MFLEFVCMCICYKPDGLPLPLCNRDYVTTLCFLQRFEPRKTAEAHFIQTNLKVKRMEFNKLCWDKTCFSCNVSSTPPIYCNSTDFFTFSCFSKPNLLHSPLFYKNPASIPDLTAMVDNCHN